jgi:hypothetical protein
MRLRTADLRDRLTEQLTPRRRRYGLVLLALFTVYSLLGLLALPGVVVSQAQKFVQEELHLALSIQKLEVNPWLLAVRIDGFALKEPDGGETLLAARSLYVNAQLWSSLWLRGASLAEVDLVEPYVNARIRRDGSINLMQLVPPSDPADQSEARWRIGLLGVHAGRIDFRDDTRPTPFAAFFSPLNLSLSDLSSRPDKDGGYTLHAETGEGEALDWRGTLAMQPLRSEGELKISGLQATTPWRYLQDQLPVVVEKGTIGISGHYRLTLGDALQFSLEQGRVTVDGLQLYQRSRDPLRLSLGRLDLNGVRLEWPQQDAGFTALVLNDLRVADKASAADLAGFGSLRLQNGRYLPAGENVELAEIALQQLTLADGTAAPMLALPALSVQKVQLGLAQQRAHAGRIVLEKGRLEVRREKNGTINWEARLDALSRRLAQGEAPVAATMPAKVSKQPASAPEKPWAATLGELDLQGFRIGVEDRVPQEAVRTALENLDLRIQPSQQPGAAHALQGRLDIATGGTLALQGNFSEQPLAVSADLDLQGLKLPPFTPYFMDYARLALESGALDVGGKFSFAQGKSSRADFNGRVAVRNFAANDLDQDERFLAWNKLAVNGLSWQLTPGRLAIRDIVADKPFMRLIVGQDKTLNLSHVIVSAPAADPAAAPAPVAAPAAASGAAPYPLRIDRIRMKDGAMLFADFTLKPQFATGIQALEGDITGISSDPASRATIKLSGRVDQYGRADIGGVINPLASDQFTDVSVNFANVELTTMTPYSAKFAGYRIDKGKLSLDLNYKIENRQLEARNKVVLNQLTLGEKVDSPEAIKLPLKLAVAILKDKNGVIDVDLPIVGSLDDPQFRVAPLVWKTLLNLITRAATAPFSLIAGMVGGGDDMDSLRFAAGQSTLLPEESSKLDKLARALADRPALGVEIRGGFDPQADALAIRSAKFDAVFQKRLADGGKPLKVLESLFKEKLGSEALARQRALSLKPAEDGDKQKLQLMEETYQKALRDELIARETVLDGDLRQLALDRARVLRAQLVEVNKVEEARIFVLEPVTVPAVDGKVTLKVALTAS